VSGYSYYMSVRTRLSDHTKQTKFQSQRPNDVETPVPSIFEYRSAATSGQSVLGWVTALSDIPISSQLTQHQISICSKTRVLFICSAISSSEKCLHISKTESYGLSRICFEMTRQATMLSSSEKCLRVSKTESYTLSRICFEMTRQATMPSLKV
jgi:hypothetical protein